jgi:NAD(P)-dependent dehydrogenase (short-subunit alcohol dehydrogenase family)
MARQTVVITGASAGVGRAVAVAFARLGWNVCGIARGEERLASMRADIERLGAPALALPADVAIADAVSAAADRVVATWGRIDVWVNCAMVTVYGFARDMTPEEYRRVTEVTYLGYVHGTLAALRHMRGQGAGTIVQVGSALAYRAIPLQSAYCAAKFAARGFTDSLRSELIHERSPIRLSMVHLPAVNTPQFDWARNHTSQRPQPVPPIFQPEPIAQAILRAARDAPRELWVGMPTVKAIVGNMVAPAALDRLLATRALRGQLSSERASPSRRDNLLAAAPGDFGAHGRFDAQARTRVPVVDPLVLRLAAAATFVAAVVALVVLLAQRSW